MKLDPLDILFSKFIRLRAMVRVGGCECCLSTKTDYKQLQCSHFWGRKRSLVRYDEDNAVGLCAGCHLYLSSNPSEHLVWFKKQLGEEAFDLLESRACQVGKIDKSAVYLYLGQKIKEIG